jgi:hypothetical protein
MIGICGEQVVKPRYNASCGVEVECDEDVLCIADSNESVGVCDRVCVVLSLSLRLVADGVLTGIETVEVVLVLSQTARALVSFL